MDYLNTIQEYYSSAKEVMALVGINLRTTAYAMSFVGAALVANAVDDIPVIGEATTLVGLLTVINFLANPEFRSDVRELIANLDDQVFKL